LSPEERGNEASGSADLLTLKVDHMLAMFSIWLLRDLIRSFTRSQPCDWIGLIVLHSALGATLYGSPLMWVMALAPLAFIFFFSFRMDRMSAAAARGTFFAFAAVMGASLSTLLIRYTGASVVQVFFITAAAFGALSLWGYTTNRSLSGMGSFLIMGLVGLILASIVNIFVASSMLQFGISVIGVLIFAGLTAYDTQKLKEMYLYGNFDQEAAAKVSVFGALTLYLDFINMFQFLLALVGNRNE
jgi:uncharacterized protein